MKKSCKGFTLVELIVVIAIIGILAAILVPALVGYIRDSKLSSANASAKTIYTAINNYAQKCLTYGTPITMGGYINSTITASDIGTEPTSFDGSSAQIDLAVGSSLNKDAVGSTYSVDFQNGFPTCVIWQKKSGDGYVGRYPEAATDTNAQLIRSH